MLDVSQVLERHEGMTSRRSNWESLWERVAQLVLPRVDDFRSKHANGSQRNLQQFDAFPMTALDKFAAAVEAGLMPRTTRWHNLETGDPDIDNDKQVKRFFEDFSDMLWRVRYSPRANFASQAHEKRISHGAFGTGCMLVEPMRGGGVRYRNIHLSEVYGEENNDGIIDIVHRKFTMTARNAIAEFKDKAPEKVRKAVEAGKLNEPFEFLHVVQPNADWEPGRVDVLPFVGCNIHEREKIRDEQHHENPYIMSRYSVSGREVYGRSPAIQMLPDISMLNEMKRTMIEVANMAADPPTLLHENISEFDLTPGAQNSGTLDDNGRSLVVPFDTRSNPGIARELMIDTRNQIDDGFLGVYFRVLLENPNMTATQAMLIAQQQGQMTAPVIGRLQTEWLDPLIRRESGILYRQGRHPEMPRTLAEYLAETGEPLSIRYESPMTRAAQAGDAVGILRAFETLAPFAQVDPKVYNIFKPMEVADIVAEVNGVPARATKSREEMDAEEDAEAQAAEAAALLQAAPVAAQTAKTVAEAQQIAASTPQPVA